MKTTTLDYCVYEYSPTDITATDIRPKAARPGFARVQRPHRHRVSARQRFLGRRGRHHALVGIDRAEALDDLHAAVDHLGDVHVHANVVLPRHHLGGAARTFSDPGMIERLD